MGKQNRLTDFNLEREIFLTDTCIRFHILEQPPTKTKTKTKTKTRTNIIRLLVTKTNTKTKIIIEFYQN